MLEHADRRDAVEGPVPYLTVVLQPDLDLSHQSRCLYPLLRQLCLLPAQGHPDYVRAVVPRRVDRKAAPSTTHIEDSSSRSIGQSELSADEVMLRVLSHLQGVTVRREAR